MTRKSFYNLSLVLLSILMILLAWNYWPNADDFCFRSRVTQQGLYEYLVSYYYNWSGRVFTLGILGILIQAVPITSSNLISIFFVLIYISALFIFVRYWKKYIPIDTLLGVFICFFFFWFGLRAIIGEVVYWPTGAATYLVPFILGYWWMHQFDLDLSEREPSWLKIIILFLASIVVGNGIEVLSPILCAYGFFMLLASYQNLSKRHKILQITKLAGIVLGTLFLVLAPGNVERAKSFPQGISFDVSSLLQNLFKVKWVFFSFTKTMLMYAFFAAMAIIILFPHLQVEIKKLRQMSWIYFLTGIASLLPMATVDLRFSTRRTTFYFAVILSLSLIFLVVSFHQEIKKKLSFLGNPKVSAFVLAIFFLSTVTSLFLDIAQAIPMRQKFLERHSILSNQTRNSSQVILLKTLGLKAPRSLFYEEITTDERHWVNSCIAHYYELKNIRLEKSSEKPKDQKEVK